MPKYGKISIMFNTKDAKQEKELYELIRELTSENLSLL